LVNRPSRQSATGINSTHLNGIRGHGLFANLDEARAWAAGFVHWYNHEHRHSGIRYVSPAQRHAGDDHAILAGRHALCTRARQENPASWSGKSRNRSPIGAVTLNPERDSIVKTHSGCTDRQPLAA
jgi:putative transposase